MRGHSEEVQLAAKPAGPGGLGEGTEGGKLTIHKETVFYADVFTHTSHNTRKLLVHSIPVSDTCDAH